MVSEFRLETLTAKIPASDWKDYKKFVDDVGAEPWIQLTSNDRVLGEKGPPPAGEDNPVAAELVRQAQNAIHEKDLELAQKKTRPGCCHQRQATISVEPVRLSCFT
jgi:hypothetical protein